MMTLRPRSRDDLLRLMDRLVAEIDEAVDDLNAFAEGTKQQQSRTTAGGTETEHGG